jgi:hypothetical protein
MMFRGRRIDQPPASLALTPAPARLGDSVTVCLGKGLMAGPVARILRAQQSTANLRLAFPLRINGMLVS